MSSVSQTDAVLRSRLTIEGYKTRNRSNRNARPADSPCSV